MLGSKVNNIAERVSYVIISETYTVTSFKELLTSRRNTDKFWVNLNKKKMQSEKIKE